MSRLTFSRRDLPKLAAGVWTASRLSAAPKDYLVYFGTYTRDKSKGIYVHRFNATTGKLTPVGLAAEAKNPSWITLHRNDKYLYSVGELGDFNGEKSGSLSAFALDKQTGKLQHLNTVSSKGTSPCHLSIDKTGRYLLCANYGTGSTVSVPIDPDGKLGQSVSQMQHEGSSVNEKRQQGPHAHSVNLSRDNRHAVVADLGLDQVLVYKFDSSTGTLTPNDPPYTKVKEGGGPRHFAFHPSYRYGYVINEMGSAVTAFAYDSQAGKLTQLQHISTLPEGWSGENNCAEVQVHPTGNFVYGSNRGHNSIAVFAVDSKKGTLKHVANTPTQGEIPRNFGIEPGGRWLIAANQNSDNVVVFKIDQQTGKLEPTGQVEEVGAPVCVKFLAL